MSKWCIKLNRISLNRPLQWFKRLTARLLKHTVSERFHQLVAFNRNSGSNRWVGPRLSQKKKVLMYLSSNDTESPLPTVVLSGVQGPDEYSSANHISILAETLAYSVTQTSAWGGADDSEGEEVKSGQIGPRRATAVQHSLLASSGMAHVRRRTARQGGWKQHRGQLTKQRLCRCSSTASWMYVRLPEIPDNESSPSPSLAVTTFGRPTHTHT